VTLKGRDARSTAVTVSATILAPNLSACFFIDSISSGPSTPSETREILHFGGERQLAAAVSPSKTSG